MAPTRSRDPVRPSTSFGAPSKEHNEGDAFALGDFEEEMKRLSAANQQLMNDLHTTDDEHNDAPTHPPLDESEELIMLRLENKELRARIQELEGFVQSSSGQSEDVWFERQREYEMLLEEKSEVIRSLHQKIQDLQENTPEPSHTTNANPGVGQAEEILRLKRELEEQRKQLRQDEEEMMEQMRQMELTMARERAEMARHRQEVNRLQADLAREIEQSSRDPSLRERLHHLRRPDTRPGTTPVLPVVPESQPEQTTSEEKPSQKNSGLLRRIFG